MSIRTEIIHRAVREKHKIAHMMHNIVMCKRCKELVGGESETED